jgi:uncharacterized Tic20 family protein
MNNEIPHNLRLIATGSHIVGATPLILFLVLTRTEPTQGFAILLFGSIFASAIQLIIVLSYWKMTRNSHPFIDLSGRNAVNCAVNNLFGTIAYFLFFWVICSVPFRVENQYSIFLTLLLVTPFILRSLQLAYFMNFVIAGIFALRGYSFKSRLIYPFLKVDKGL